MPRCSTSMSSVRRRRRGMRWRWRSSSETWRNSNIRLPSPQVWRGSLPKNKFRKFQGMREIKKTKGWDCNVHFWCNILQKWKSRTLFKAYLNWGSCKLFNHFLFVYTVPLRMDDNQNVLSPRINESLPWERKTFKFLKAVSTFSSWSKCKCRTQNYVFNDFRI